MRSAAADPDAFRLLFRHAAREREFRDLTDSLTATSTEIARRNLASGLALDNQLSHRREQHVIAFTEQFSYLLGQSTRIEPSVPQTLEKK